MRIAPPPVSEVLATLKRDGIHVLEGILSAGDVDAIREETEWFLSRPRPWYKLDRQGPETFAVVAPRAVPRSASGRLQRVLALFS